MFEYDPDKSDANRIKHGIDFDQAQAIWSDEARLAYASNANGEPRWIVVGLIGDRVWAAVHTIRGDRIRIISVRRARKEEVEHYVHWQENQR